MTDQSVLDWRLAGRYLPRFMRDFHDRKDLFKTIHETIAVEEHEYCSSISWVAGQCYVIDIFLWFMARHGYTLQKTDRKLPFDDLQETIETTQKASRNMLAALLKQAREEKKNV